MHVIGVFGEEAKSVNHREHRGSQGKPVVHTG